jgi:hypothetical protein
MPAVAIDALHAPEVVSSDNSPTGKSRDASAIALFRIEIAVKLFENFNLCTETFQSGFSGSTMIAVILSEKFHVRKIFGKIFKRGRCLPLK